MYRTRQVIVLHGRHIIQANIKRHGRRLGPQVSSHHLQTFTLPVQSGPSVTLISTRISPTHPDSPSGVHRTFTQALSTTLTKLSSQLGILLKFTPTTSNHNIFGIGAPSVIVEPSHLVAPVFGVQWGRRLHNRMELVEILKQNRFTRLQIMLHRAESDLLLVALNHDCIHKLDRVKVGERVAL